MSHTISVATEIRLPFVPLVSFVTYNTLLLGLLLFSALTVLDFLVLIYFELGVIGFFALLRLFVATVVGRSIRIGRIEFGGNCIEMLVTCTVLTVIFLSIFGTVMFGLGIMLINLPHEVDLDVTWLDNSHPLVTMSLFGLLLNHGVTFAWSTLIRHGYRHESIFKLLLYPYFRGWWAFVVITLEVSVSVVQS